MFCSNCGTELPPEVQACPRCGAVIARASPTPLGTAQNADQIIAENPPPELQQVQSWIPLNEGERILWHKETTHGLVHKEVVMEEAVTNKPCLKYSTESKQVVAQIGITHWPEVVIMNLHRVNDSLGGGVFLTPRMFGLPGLGGFGVYGGPRRGLIKVFVNISFLSEGKVIMTFENVKEREFTKLEQIEVVKVQEIVKLLQQANG